MLETTIEIDNYEKHPIKKMEWEVTKQVRQFTYKLSQVDKGSGFGHEEILNGYNSRRCRAVAQSNTTLLYFTK